MSKATDDWVPQVRRDLNWLLESPSLIPHTNSLQNTIQQTPESISDDLIREHFTDTPTHRVGQYCEQLINFWLTNVLALNVRHRNYQVREDKKTLGELDFVFETTSGEILHWEIAVKFYLFCEDTICLGSHYIGPNTNDTFERKMDRLLKSQLPLGPKVFPEIHRSEPFVKGRIFYHPNDKNHLEGPATLSPHHLRGTWLRIDELGPYLVKTEARSCCTLKKPFWLSNVVSPGTEHRLSCTEMTAHLRTHFEGSDHAILIATFRDGDGILEECERIFVVGSDWPHKAVPAQGVSSANNMIATSDPS